VILTLSDHLIKNIAGAFQPGFGIRISFLVLSIKITACFTQIKYPFMHPLYIQPYVRFYTSWHWSRPLQGKMGQVSGKRKD